MVTENARESDTLGGDFPLFAPQLDRQGRPIGHEIALREFLVADLLRPVIIWLLGHDARTPLGQKQARDLGPIRAQMGGSHWMTALSLMLFLQARPLLPDGDPAVKEIEQRLGSSLESASPLRWLLNQAQPLESGRWRWYGNDYDTAVVTTALLCVFDHVRQRQITIPGDVMTLLEGRLRGALAWLYDHLATAVTNAQDDEEAIELIEPLTIAHGRLFPAIRHLLPASATNAEDPYYQAVDSWLKFLNAQAPAAHTRSGRQGNEEPFQLRSVVVENCLFTLVECCRDAGPNERASLIHHALTARQLLLTHTHYVRNRLLTDQWSGSIVRIQRLGSYVDACAAAATALESFDALAPQESVQAPSLLEDALVAESEVILRVLKVVKNEFFTNGSIFHSLYPTVYFGRALLSIVHWREAPEPIVRLYLRQVDQRPGRASLERKEIFDLRSRLSSRELVLHEERRVAAQQRKSLIRRERVKRFGLLSVTWILILGAIVDLIGGRVLQLSLSDMLTFIGLTGAATAIVLFLLEIFLLRER